VLIIQHYGRPVNSVSEVIQAELPIVS